MARIIVTGADGFIGTPLTRMLIEAGHDVVPVTRKDFVLGDPKTLSSRLRSAISGAQTVIHLAGRAHVMRESHTDPLAAFRSANVEGTSAIADAAAEVGVGRFVFMSSIGVLGNSSGTGQFSERNQPSPEGPYAVSKWEAERELHAIAARTGLAVVVVRPPLVYGANVKGNFLRLLELVRQGFPLPFGAVQNSRSYVGLSNLCEFLMLCAAHPSAAGRTFHVADGDDTSTPALLRVIAHEMHRKIRIFRCPAPLLRAVATLAGKGADLERLINNLRVDASLARTELGWTPAVSMRDGIGQMVRSFVSATRLDET
jgi:nucleoside-diphosphate-sugar epimerase